MTNGDSGTSTRELKRVERLAKLEVKLDTLIGKVDDLNATIGRRIENHESRLVKLERVVWIETGVFLLIIVPSGLALISRLLGLLF